MNLLLDTAALIWWLEGNPRLGSAARAAIVEGENQFFVSAASVWEMAIKASRGRLGFPGRLRDWLPEQLTKYAFASLPVSLAHAAAVEDLPLHHRDPFDRILVAQAMTEGLRVVTSDERLSQYQISVLRCS